MARTIRKETSDRAIQEETGDGFGAHALNKAVWDACYVYQYRDLEQNLRKSGWRKARRRVLGHGALSGEWVGRGRSEVRLTRRGLEVRLAGETRRLSWQDLHDFVRAQRY
jgi:hypothetical protein